MFNSTLNWWDGVHVRLVMKLAESDLLTRFLLLCCSRLRLSRKCS